MMLKYEMIIVWSKEDDTFVAEVPELPGCMAHGATYEEALANLHEAVTLWVDTAREFGRQITEQGVAESVVFKDGANVFAFPDLKLSPFPAWLKPDLWTHLRVTVRGRDLAKEKVRVQFLSEPIE